MAMLLWQMIFIIIFNFYATDFDISAIAFVIVAKRVIMMMLHTAN